VGAFLLKMLDSPEKALVVSSPANPNAAGEAGGIWVCQVQREVMPHGTYHCSFIIVLALPTFQPATARVRNQKLIAA
jgi:hypothetical protein